jgi:hypothetical protein
MHFLDKKFQKKEKKFNFRKDWGKTIPLGFAASLCEELFWAKLLQEKTVCNY